MIPKSTDILRTAAAAKIERHDVIMLRTDAAQSIGELLGILEQIHWDPMQTVQPSSLEEIEGYYMVEARAPNVDWFKYPGRDGRFSSIEEDCLQALRKARTLYGRANVRLVRCTKSVVAGSAG